MSIGVCISKGNIKLGSIPNVNLPPIVTCESGVPCAQKNGCYALKAYRQYPNVRNAWNNNLNVYSMNPDFYFESICKQLGKMKNLPRFRWHSSGDMVD